MSNNHNFSVIDRAYVDHYKTKSHDEFTHDINSLAHREYNEALQAHWSNLKFMTRLGIAAYLVLYPFRRAQLMTMVRPDLHKQFPFANYRFSALVFIARFEGIHRIYRGVIPNTLAWAPTMWVAMFAQDFFSTPDALYNQNPEKMFGFEPMLRSFATASTVLAFQMLMHPVRVAGIKMATDINVRGVSTGYRYKTSLDCLARVIRFNGFQGLGAGMKTYVFRSFLFWVLTNAKVQKLQHDEFHGTFTMHRWLHFLYEYRYQVTFTLLAWGLQPFETIMTRQIYRLPTFKEDFLPKQFPKLYFPTFAGLFSLYRGSFTTICCTLILTLWSKFLSDIYIEACTPKHLHSKYQTMLWSARWAVMNRHRDEAAGAVGVYPEYHPLYGVNTYRQLPRYAGHGVGERFALQSRQNGVTHY